MIVGFVLLLIIISVFAVREYVIKSSLQRQAEAAVTVPEKIKPIKDNFDSCIKFLTEQAITIAGTQSGYVNAPIDNTPINPTLPFSNSVEIATGINVPYWFYESPNGIQKSQVPTLEEMQTQIADYIKNNIGICSSGLNEFVPEGYDFQLPKNIQSEVTINDDLTISKVTIPLKISISGLTFDLSNYPVFAKINVPLGRMYKIARGIQAEEDVNNFFEEKTFDAMIAFSEIPVSGTEFSCTQKFWTKQDVLQSMKNIISSNINAIHIKGAYQDVNTINQYFDIDPKVDSTNINALFLYSTRWPMSVNIIPSDGPILKSDQLMRHFSDETSSLLSSILCINQWNFVYDIKFPMLVSLVDVNAMDGKGFTFQFADMIIIKHNQPKQNILGTYDQPDFAFPLCKNPNTDVSVYTFTVDEMNQLEPLSGVSINFKCFTTKCDLGITSEDEFNEASVTTLFPQCINGLIIGEKEGYYKGQQTISTNEPQQLSLILEKLRTVNLNVKLIEKNNGDVRDPYSSEQVLFTLKNKNNDFSRSFVYPGTDSIDLIPGDYSIESYIIGNSTWPIQIKGGTIEKCVDVPKLSILGISFNEKHCSSTKIDDMIVNEVVKGGADFDWQLTRDQLNKGSITFYTMADKIPGDYASLNIIYLSITKNAQSPYFKEPE